MFHKSYIYINVTRAEDGKSFICAAFRSVLNCLTLETLTGRKGGFLFLLLRLLLLLLLTA